MMLRPRSLASALVVALSLTTASAVIAAEPAGLKPGSPKLTSIGPLAFGPDDVLFIADPQAAAIVAVKLPAASKTQPNAKLRIEGIDSKIASMLGTEARDILIQDMAVNPSTGEAYLSVSRGRGPEAQAALIRVAPDGTLTDVALKDVPFAKADLPSAPSGRGRAEAITDMAYVDGRVFVAGLSNEEFASKLRAIPYPFSQLDAGASVEIFHGAHGQFETRSPVRTFVPYTIAGEPYLLAAYTCTPLVKFPVSELKPGAHVKGTTVAELGNRNKPLDMVAYTKGGKSYLLLANSSRGVMKITTDGIDKAESITKRIDGTAGQTYETIGSLKGVEQLDALGDGHALILSRGDNGMTLEAIELP